MDEQQQQIQEKDQGLWEEFGHYIWKRGLLELEDKDPWAKYHAYRGVNNQKEGQGDC